MELTSKELEEFADEIIDALTPMGDDIRSIAWCGEQNSAVVIDFPYRGNAEDVRTEPLEERADRVLRERREAVRDVIAEWLSDED